MTAVTLFVSRGKRTGSSFIKSFNTSGHDRHPVSSGCRPLALKQQTFIFAVLEGGVQGQGASRSGIW